MDRGTVSDNKSGRMEQNTKESGCSIKQTARANSGTLMETFIRVSGRTTRQMDSVFIHMLTAPSMKESGWMIYKKVREQKYGRIRALIKVLTKPV
jgi:hypothetical protein